MSPTSRELELESSIPSASTSASRGLLEELREGMPAPTRAERRPALEEEGVSAGLRGRVVWIVAVVESRAEFCIRIKSSEQILR